MSKKSRCVAYLVDQDASMLAQELKRAGLIKKEVVEHLTNIPPEVPNYMKHRYLFSHVFTETSRNEDSFMKMIDILLQFPSNSETTDSSASTLICLKHIPEIAEILANYAYKWRLIGTALRFLPQELDSIEVCVRWFDSPKRELLLLLQKWINKESKHALPATLKNLSCALNSQLIGLGALVDEINEVFADSIAVTSCTPYQPAKHVIMSVSLYDQPLKDQPFNYLIPDVDLCEVACHQCQNIRVIEAIENESVLFELQKTNSSRKVEVLYYQWQINSSREASGRRFLHIEADMCLHNFQYSCNLMLKDHYDPFAAKDKMVTTNSVTLQVSTPLDSIRDELVSMYLDQPEVPKDSWPPISSKKYVNLAVIKHETIDYMKRSTQFTIRGDLDDILKNKEMIKYKGLIASLKCGNILIIEGRPGSGKTTFVHKVTRDWALTPQEYSRSIRSLFLVSLRVLNTLNKPLVLADILLLFKKIDVTPELIEKRLGKGVCFIFDGLDEFSPPDGERSIIYRIIRKEYLPSSIAIVASRPAATAHLRSKACKVIEVLGFKEGQILEYFNHYPFSEPTKPVKLKEYLTSHPNILHMCYLPIHAVMVAFLFEVTGSVPRTETEIYTHFTRFTVMRSVSKDTDLKVHVTDIETLGKEHVFQKVCELALEKTILNEQVMHEKEVNLICSDEQEIACLGLLTVDRTAGLYGYTNVYTFLHLTFQEYLAACNISTLSYDKQVALIQKYGHRDHMLMVWKFFCGLVKFDISTIDSRFQLLLQKIDKGPLFHIQCAYESQQDIACTQMLKKVNYHIDIRDQRHISIPDFTAVGFVANKSVISIDLSLFNCNITTGVMNALAVEMKQNNNFGKLKIHQSLNAIESVKELAIFLQHSRNLKELDIRFNKMDDTGAEIIAEAFVNCTSLKQLAISNSKLTSKGVQELFKSFSKLGMDYNDTEPRTFDETTWNVSSFNLLVADDNQCESSALLSALINWPCIELLSFEVQMNTCIIDLFGKNRERQMTINCSASATFWGCLKDAPELQTLSIRTGAISNSELGKVASVIKKCRYLQVLDLGNNAIDDTTMQTFFNNVGACFNPTEINLQNNKINFLDIQTFSWIEKFSCLQKLNLSNNNLSKGSAKVLVSCLQHCPDLVVLNLDNNAIGTTGLIAITKALCNLQELHLGNNRIGSEGAKALASHLKQRCNLLAYRLSLKGNEIGRDGIIALVQSLAHCPNLQELDLSGNFVGVAGVKMILESLRHDAANIQKLHLNTCQVSNDGAVTVASHLKHFHKLQCLSLMNNGIGRIGVQALAEGFSQCSCLQCIDLSTNNFGIVEITTLSKGLKNCHSLSELHLADNKIEYDGVKVLSSHFIHYRNLQGMNLSNNNIARVGAKILSENLKNCTKLVWLDLSGNLIDQEAALAVVSGVNYCTDFEKLDLSRNRIADTQTLQAELAYHGVTIITGQTETRRDSAIATIAPVKKVSLWDFLQAP